MTTLSDDSQRALQQALLRYRRNLGTKALELEESWQQAQQGDTEQRQHLLTLLHRLSGSAGLYELPELGTQAKLTHRALKSYSDESAATLQQLLQMMHQVAAAEIQQHNH